jgi:hypothetical protein
MSLHLSHAHDFLEVTKNARFRQRKRRIFAEGKTFLCYLLSVMRRIYTSEDEVTYMTGINATRLVDSIDGIDASLSQLTREVREIATIRVDLDRERAGRLEDQKEIRLAQQKIKTLEEELDRERSKVLESEAKPVVPATPPPIRYPETPSEHEPVAEDANRACLLCNERERTAVIVECGCFYACVTCIQATRPKQCLRCKKPIFCVVRLNVIQ